MKVRIPIVLSAGALLLAVSCTEKPAITPEKEPVTVVVDTSYKIDPLQGFALEELLPELRTSPYLSTDMNEDYIFSLLSDTTHVSVPMDLIQADASENSYHCTYTSQKKGNSWVFTNTGTSTPSFIIPHFRIPAIVDRFHSGTPHGRITLRIRFDSDFPFSCIRINTYDSIIFPFGLTDGTRKFDRIELRDKVIPKEGLEYTYDLNSMGYHWVQHEDGYSYETTVTTISTFTALESDLERPLNPEENLQAQIHYEFILTDVSLSPALVSLHLPQAVLKPFQPTGLPSFITDYPVAFPKVDAFLYAKYDGLLNQMDMKGTFAAQGSSGEEIQTQPFSTVNSYRKNEAYLFGKDGRDIHMQTSARLDNLSDLYAHPFPVEWSVNGFEYPTDVTLEAKTGKTYDLAFAFGHRAMMTLSSGLEGLRLVRNLGRIQTETLKTISFTEATVQAQVTNGIPMGFHLEARVLDAAGNPVPGVTVTCPDNIGYSYPPVKRPVEFQLHSDHEINTGDLYLECTFIVHSNHAISLSQGQELSFSDPLLATTVEVVKYQ